jgi:hypothetical protein
MTILVTTTCDVTQGDSGRAATPRGPGPMARVLGTLVLVAAVAVLSGCGGSSSSGAVPASSSASVKDTDSSGSAPAAGSSKAPYTDAEACAWLKKDLPTVPASEIGAQAQLTIGLSSFFEEHGGLEGADGYALDDAFSRGCPALRSAALKKAGIKSFGNL